MTGIFPPAEVEAQYARFKRDEEQLGPGIRAICDRLDLASRPAMRFADGSLPVYALGDDLVLKVYPPFCAGERDIESSVLSAVDGRLPTSTPRVHAIGDLEGWGYVLMSRLEGESLALAWPRLSAEARARVAARVGETLAALHEISAPDHPAVRIDWPRFIDEQRRSAVERQRARGLDAAWLEQIDDFLATTPLDDARPASLLHTEVMREHLRVRESSEGFTLSGLFDFEPAVAGAREYEFASVGIFVSCGDPSLLRRLLRAYGLAEVDLDEALEQRLLAYGILHRYSDLPWYLSRIPAPPGLRDLTLLGRHFWGVR